MHILRKREPIHVESFSLGFLFKNDRNAGFSFPCDRDGTPLLGEMSPERQENLRKCLSGEHAVVPEGVIDLGHMYYRPAEGRCSACETIVILESSWLNVCETCGQNYNGSGQQLTPQRQWEEYEPGDNPYEERGVEDIDE